MGRRARSGWLKHTAVLAAAVLASLGTLRAAESLTLADGSVLSVWTARGRLAGNGSAAAPGSALAWSLGGTSGGIVAPTGDAAADADPRLVLDRTTGTVFLLWSRADGAAYKIHYARFQAGAWVDAHALTFGRGNDRHPRAGFDHAGATLFFVADGSRYFHAPFDPAYGRLFAAPRLLARLVGYAPAPILGEGGDLFVNGGLDAPVPPTDRTCTGGCSSATTWSGATSTQGGMDAPVPPTNQGGSKPTGSGKNASAWGVAGDASCGSQILVVPARDFPGAHVIRYTDGQTRVLARIPLPATVPPGFGDQAARTYLPSVCW